MPSPTSARPPLAKRLRPWEYDDSTGRRDERIDFLRGLAMLAVIINHVSIPSLYHHVSVEAIGIVTGAEAFVLLSGIAAGFIYRQRLAKYGWRAAATKLARRSIILYCVTLATNLLVYLLGFVPGIDPSVLTRYREFSLYGENPSVSTFIAGMLTLAYGPGQNNILGLYVALVAATPLLLWFLHKGRTLTVLGMSWATYILHAVHPFRALPFQSENSFPLLAWQLLFVHGLVAGYHREKIMAVNRDRFGGLLRASVVSLSIGFCLYALSSPWHDVRGPAPFSLMSESAYYWAYELLFQRTRLGIGRFVNIIVLTATLYMALTRYWVPSKRIAGWLCIPLGRASLFVFVVHLFFVLIAYNIPLLLRHLIVVNTIAHTFVILAIWAMVLKSPWNSPRVSSSR